ncbi:MAG TPA: GtrA family protein [Caulobacteraceae bacterium]|jgi:putative flippase GtrA|nr:GtrA family protein [Caulobacteraceae bacterium]
MSEASGAIRRVEGRPFPALLRRLYARAPKGLIRFLAVGVGGLSVDIAVLWLLEQAGMGHVAARAASLTVATLATWALNRQFTFGDSGRRAHAELGRYVLVALIAQSVNLAVFVALTAFWPTMIHAIAAVIGAVVATGFSYTGQRFFTFARGGAD